jgi:ATP-dependent DNA ligase
MEARSAEEIPIGPQWQYEPKWDGFRCIAARNGSRVELTSKAGRPLARYFPELVAALLELEAPRFIIDAEIVVPIAGRLSFDDLLMRVHPAASRVRLLSEQHPATLVVFDLLENERGTSMIALPLAERRPLLEKFAARFLPRRHRFRLSPATIDLKTATAWLAGSGGDLDGVIAKRLDLPYRAGLRDGMVKVKRKRTADCVVGGYRLAAGGRAIGSLLLGLYNERGELDHVGFTSSFPLAERSAMLARLKPLHAESSFTGKTPGGPSRWNQGKSTEWQPLKLKLVVEVEYDHFTGGRFRHGTHLLRWRPDKPAKACTIDQVAQSGAELDVASATPSVRSPRKRKA